MDYLEGRGINNVNIKKDVFSSPKCTLALDSGKQNQATVMRKLQRVKSHSLEFVGIVILLGAVFNSLPAYAETYRTFNISFPDGCPVGSKRIRVEQCRAEGNYEFYRTNRAMPYCPGAKYAGYGWCRISR